MSKRLNNKTIKVELEFDNETYVKGFKEVCFALLHNQKILFVYEELEESAVN